MSSTTLSSVVVVSVIVVNSASYTCIYSNLG